MKKKTLVMIIIVSCVVIALAVGTFLFLSRNQTNDDDFSIDSIIPRGAFA